MFLEKRATSKSFHFMDDWTGTTDKVSDYIFGLQYNTEFSS